MSEIIGRVGNEHNNSNYLVTRINWGEFFIGSVGLVLLAILTLGSHRIREACKAPILFVCTGTLIWWVGVQPWVRSKSSYWISLTASSITQFLVGHWLVVYHPAFAKSDFKAAGVLSMLAGAVVGVPLFLLLQRLKSARALRPPNNEYIPRRLKPGLFLLSLAARMNPCPFKTASRLSFSATSGARRYNWVALRGYSLGAKYPLRACTW